MPGYLRSMKFILMILKSGSIFTFLPFTFYISLFTFLTARNKNSARAFSRNVLISVNSLTSVLLD